MGSLKTDYSEHIRQRTLQQERRLGPNDIAELLKRHFLAAEHESEQELFPLVAGSITDTRSAYAPTPEHPNSAIPDRSLISPTKPSASPAEGGHPSNSTGINWSEEQLPSTSGLGRGHRWGNVRGSGHGALISKVKTSLKCVNYSASGDSDSDSSVELPSNHSSASAIELPICQPESNKDDASCLFCQGKFSDDREGEL
ncbi:hypothetical protein PR048_020741 [Dryococelus australis]|uniref:Uncharacterized protein n=1 Tax=Dryococelus australis TaxID=614101 RepID=A0ABQ9H7K8_9NEOP|nr:hypothetical protein PR048_020741 [Dryococelus australis]